MEPGKKTLRIGISACLLGQNVRYDGGHKLDRYLRDTMGAFVEWIPVCPEVECGLPTPREAVRLVGDPRSPRLMTSRTGKDLTGQMRSWISKRLPELEKEDLCGFVFKTKSPSSGMRDIKVYTEKGMPSTKGVGMFARDFMDRFPMIPVEDEGRLHDAGIRENFIERVFVFHRWKAMTEGDLKLSRLVDFHTDHKYLIMSHSPKHLSVLGRIVAETKGKRIEDIFNDYFNALFDTLRLKSTVKKHVNVLHHMVGYFKKLISPDEKQELLEVIENFHRLYVPLVVPLTLLGHYVKKYNQPYLSGQIYLNPHPVELMLRNHV